MPIHLGCPQVPAMLGRCPADPLPAGLVPPAGCRPGPTFCTLLAAVARPGPPATTDEARQTTYQPDIAGIGCMFAGHRHDVLYGACGNCWPPSTLLAPMQTIREAGEGRSRLWAFPFPFLPRPQFYLRQSMILHCLTPQP